MSEKKEIVKEYPKEQALTILWKPKKCIHSEICVKALPEVYRPKEKPWIRPENASVEALKEQIDQCPSGALAYRDPKASEDRETPQVHASILKGGPLLIKGTFAFENQGTRERMEGTTAFCRCGASGRKPFCDGSHTKVNFEAT